MGHHQSHQLPMWVKSIALVLTAVCLCVLTAEKVTSLGKDWHRPCLRCVKCNKTLSSGSHAEVRRHHLSAPGC